MLQFLINEIGVQYPAKALCLLVELAHAIWVAAAGRGRGSGLGTDEGEEDLEEFVQEGLHPRGHAEGQSAANGKVGNYRVLGREGETLADADATVGTTVDIKGDAGAVRVEFVEDGTPVQFCLIALSATRRCAELETRVEKEVVTCERGRSE